MKTLRIEPRLLKGFRDYLPADAVPLQRLMATIQKTFEKFGFDPTETPALEHADLLLGKYGPEGDKLMYRFLDHGERQVALRYDHTVPLARLVAMHADLPMPFKRYVLAPVWRADKPQRGRFREFYQCDADIIGSDQARADGEILALAYTLLDGLGIKKFGLQVNHRGVLDALARAVGLAATQIPGVFHAIDKFPKYGEASFVTDVRSLGVSVEQTKALLDLIAQHGPAKKVLPKLAERITDDKGKAALAELDAILEHASAFGVPESHLNVDLKIVRGLDYYTGMIVESVIADLPLFGSVFGGGRYDGLIGSLMGGKKKVPAVGISLGLSRFYDALRELNLAPPTTTNTQVLVAIVDAAGGASAEKLAHELRSLGINVEVYLGPPGKLEKQLKFADRRGIPLLVWQGPEERDKDVVLMKDLTARKQTILERDQAPDVIARRVQAN